MCPWLLPQRLARATGIADVWRAAEAFVTATVAALKTSPFIAWCWNSKHILLQRVVCCDRNSCMVRYSCCCSMTCSLFFQISFARLRYRVNSLDIKSARMQRYIKRRLTRPATQRGGTPRQYNLSASSVAAESLQTNRRQTTKPAYILLGYISPAIYEPATYYMNQKYIT